LCATWLVTVTITVSSSLAYKVGPGNFPLTDTKDFVEQSFVSFFSTTCTQWPSWNVYFLF